MVPWVLTTKKEKVPKKRKQKKRGGEGVAPDDGEGEKEGDVQGEEKPDVKPEGDKTFLRYYHLYKKGELEEDIEKAGGKVLESGYEKDNWWAISSLK